VARLSSPARARAAAPVLMAVVAVWLAAARAHAQTPAPDDGPAPFQASAYVGVVYDNFAPPALAGYKTDTEGGTSKARFIGGIDFEMRAIGTGDGHFQLWITGQTLHGVRSADVDCSTDASGRPPVCDTLTADPQSASKRLLYTFEHATSLEAYLAPRFEFLTLQRGTTFPSKLYATVRFGVLMLTDQGSKAFDVHHAGLGLRAPVGPFRGSYLELGWGKSDMFVSTPGRNKYHRFKIDAQLSFPIVSTSPRVPRAFVQLYSDFDPIGESADSIQTFVGLDFDIDSLFRF
jgi:hypothetical protein